MVRVHFGGGTHLDGLCHVTGAGASGCSCSCGRLRVSPDRSSAESEALDRAGRLLDDLTTGGDPAGLERLQSVADVPQSDSTPRAPDGRLVLEQLPLGEGPPALNVRLTVPSAWAELGGVLCFEVVEGLSGCQAARDAALTPRDVTSFRGMVGEPVALVWSRNPVGPAFDPVVLGSTPIPDLPCERRFTADIDIDITAENRLREAVGNQQLVTWGQIDRPPSATPPGDTPTPGPTPCG